MQIFLLFLYLHCSKWKESYIDHKFYSKSILLVICLLGRIELNAIAAMSWTIALRKRFLYWILHDPKANQESFVRVIASLYCLVSSIFLYSIKHLELPPKVIGLGLSNLFVPPKLVKSGRDYITSGLLIFWWDPQLNFSES